MNTGDAKFIRFGIALAILIARASRERPSQGGEHDADVAFEGADAFIKKSKEVGAYPDAKVKP